MIESLGVRRRPRRVEGDRSAQLVERPERRIDRGADAGTQVVGQLAAMAEANALDDRERVAVRRRRLGRDVQLVEQPEDPGLRRADPLAAQLEDGAVGEDPVVHAPADPVARLEHDAGRTGIG